MSRDEIKKAIRDRITQLRQQAADYNSREPRLRWAHLAREDDARALECERILDLFGRYSR